MITVDVTKMWIQRKYLQTKYLVRKLIQKNYKKFAFQENLATDINMFFPLRQKNKDRFMIRAPHYSQSKWKLSIT